MLKPTALLLSLLAAPAFAGTIAVQWTKPVDGAAVQATLDARARQMGYRTDGHDVGTDLGTFYLTAPDATVDGVVRHLIWMEARHLLPAGMRIGTAATKDGPYRAAYPADLTSFDIRKN